MNSQQYLQYLLIENVIVEKDNEYFYAYDNNDNYISVKCDAKPYGYVLTYIDSSDNLKKFKQKHKLSNCPTLKSVESYLESIIKNI